MSLHTIKREIVGLPYRTNTENSVVWIGEEFPCPYVKCLAKGDIYNHHRCLRRVFGSSFYYCECSDCWTDESRYVHYQTGNEYCTPCERGIHPSPYRNFKIEMYTGVPNDNLY